MGLRNDDNQFIWHPYTQMKTAQPPIQIVKGKGTYLYDDKGVKYIDAISSWWVNVHGHAHPEISNAISEQSSILEQVIFAGFTHPKSHRISQQVDKQVA